MLIRWSSQLPYFYRSKLLLTEPEFFCKGKADSKKEDEAGLVREPGVDAGVVHQNGITGDQYRNFVHESISFPDQRKLLKSYSISVI